MSREMQTTLKATMRKHSAKNKINKKATLVLLNTDQYYLSRTRDWRSNRQPAFIISCLLAVATLTALVLRSSKSIVSFNSTIATGHDDSAATSVVSSIQEQQQQHAEELPLSQQPQQQHQQQHALETVAPQEPPPMTVKHQRKPKQDPSTMPIVYFHMQGSIQEDHYVWESICASAKNHNKHIIFATTATDYQIPMYLQTNISSLEMFHFNQSLLEDRHEEPSIRALQKFRAVYRTGWGYREPFERICMERFFYLQYFMEVRGLDRILYFDSDAAMMSQVDATLTDPTCDGMLPMHDRIGQSKSVADYAWSIWIGTGSVLSTAVLSDFNTFVVKAYGTNSSHNVLRTKFEKKPFVTDMTLWYLYLIASSQLFREEYAHDQNLMLMQQLPPTPQHVFCDTAKVGFSDLQYVKWKRLGYHRKKRGRPRNLGFHGLDKGYLKGFCLPTASKNESNS